MGEENEDGTGKQLQNHYASVTSDFPVDHQNVPEQHIFSLRLKGKMMQYRWGEVMKDRNL